MYELIFWEVCQSIVLNLCLSLPTWDYKYEKDARIYCRQKNAGKKDKLLLNSAMQYFVSVSITDCMGYSGHFKFKSLWGVIKCLVL